MVRTFNLHSLVALGLCALLVSGCGDDEKQSGPVDGSVDPATGAGDGGSKDADGPEAPPDQGSLDGGDGDAHPTPQPDGGTTEKPMSGTLLDLPYSGELLSLCYQNADCKGAGLGCYAAFGTVAGFCSAKCEKDGDCKPIGGVVATCSPEGLCRVDCSGKDDNGDGACPTNMRCRDVFDPSVVVAGEESEPGLISIWRCGYPVHAGSNRVELYQECDLDHGSGDCKGELLCHAPSSALGSPANPGYCAQACESQAQCTVPSGATSVAVCTEGACELDCAAAGATCPSGMNCRQVGGPISEVRHRCRFVAGKAP